ncbi:MAG: RluA family pseudouridine synthase [Patescibacteria group bacterium]
MRIDKYLTNKYPSLSRAYIKNQIKLGNFLVFNKKVESRLKNVASLFSEAGRNPAPKADQDKQSTSNSDLRLSGAGVKPSYILREGDIVVFALGFVLPDAVIILPNPAIKLNVIYEDADVLVINKPAGLSVHPRQDKNGLPLLPEINSTLVSGLLAYYSAIASVGDNPLFRPGLVHRLDKDTSGVMIIAKNQRSFDWLKAQFKEHQTAKKYIALTHGLFKEKQGVIKTILARAKNNPTKQKISAKEGKEAVTEYRVIKEFKSYSLIEAQPKTGRLHQIRVHLAHLGHSIVGDVKYGLKNEIKLAGLDRQFLHAKELKIILLDNKENTFVAPLPDDLLGVLQALEKNK